MLITRKAEFSASHACRDPRLTPERNRKVYGKESRPHGHNWVVEVTLRGDVDPVHGMVLDLKALKEIIRRNVIEPYDHRFLNHEVPPFDRIVPTAEHLARDIWRRLAGPIASTGGTLHAVRLHETDEMYVDYSEQPAQ